MHFISMKHQRSAPQGALQHREQRAKNVLVSLKFGLGWKESSPHGKQPLTAQL